MHTARDEEEIEFWDTEIGQVLDAIKMGHMDKHIKEIAKACFTRRDVIDPNWADRNVGTLTAGAQLLEVGNDGTVIRKLAGGSAGVVTDAQPPAADHHKIRASELPPTPNLTLPPTYPPVTTVRQASADDSERACFSMACPDGQERTFKRADVIGHTISLVSPKAMAGVRVRITGIGPSRLQGVLLDEPPATSAWHNNWATQAPIYLPRSYIRQHLIY